MSHTRDRFLVYGRSQIANRHRLALKTVVTVGTELRMPIPYEEIGMTEIATDERGRITIPQKTRERFGEHYRLVELEHGIKLIPIDDDPLKGLRDAVGDAFADKDAADLKEEARKTAVQQIQERHRHRSEKSETDHNEE